MKKHMKHNRKIVKFSINVVSIPIIRRENYFKPILLNVTEMWKLIKRNISHVDDTKRERERERERERNGYFQWTKKKKI